MDYEKKYKESMAKMSTFLAKHDGFTISKDGEMYKELSEIFPELKESEDDRIRKELLEHCKNLAKPYIQTGNNCPQIQSWITWLEKQGEQSSLNTNQDCLKGIKQVQEYQDLSNWEKGFDDIASRYAYNKNQEGYNNSEYVKERAAEMLYHAKKELEKQTEQKATWTKEDEERYLSCLKKLSTGDIEQPETVNTIWFKSLKERISCGANYIPKQGWSKDDEEIILKMMFAFTTRVFPSSKECGSFIDFLKSLIKTSKLYD